MSNTEIISEALNLPLSERLLIVNTLVESFNTMDTDTEQAWIKEVERRKTLLENEEIETLSYEAFFAKN